MTQRFFIIKHEPRSIESLPLVGRTSTRCDGALLIGGNEMTITQAQNKLSRLGYNAYIEHGHLYVRNTEGGVEEVNNAAYLEILLNRARDQRKRGSA